MPPFILTITLGIRVSINCNCCNGPRLSTIAGDHISCSAGGALRLIIVRIGNVHDQRRVDILVRRHSSTSSLLTFDSSAPALGFPAICMKSAIRPHDIQ